MGRTFAAAIIMTAMAGLATAAPPPPSAKPPSWRCFVRDAMVFYDRTHVRCYNKTAQGVTYFAVDTSQPIANSVVSKAVSAMQQGKPVKIVYAPGPDLNPPGCEKADCRRLLDITF